MPLSSGPDLEITAALLPTAPAAASADRASLKQVERSHILAVLRQTNWRIDRAQGAARILKPTRTRCAAGCSGSASGGRPMRENDGRSR